MTPEKIPENKKIMSEFIMEKQASEKRAAVIRVCWLWILIPTALFPVIFSIATVPFFMTEASPGALPNKVLLAFIWLMGITQAAVQVAVFLGLGLHRRSSEWIVERCVAFYFFAPLITHIVLEALILLEFEISSIVEPSRAALVTYIENLGDIDSYLIDRNSPVVASAIFVLIVYLVLRRRLGFFHRGRKTGAYLPIFRNTGQALWSALDDIEQRTDLFTRRRASYSVWLSRATNETLPSVYTIHGDSYTQNLLLVPRGFFRVLKEKPLSARAILAHELAHIHQGDADLWSTIDIYMSVMARAVILTSVTPFIMDALSYALKADYKVKMVDFIGHGPARLLYLLPLVGCYLAIVHARKKSEFVADMFSACVVGSDATASAISQFASDGSPLHPSRRERLARMEARTEKPDLQGNRVNG